jgi:hypothetical protein
MNASLTHLSTRHVTQHFSRNGMISAAFCADTGMRDMEIRDIAPVSGGKRE